MNSNRPQSHSAMTAVACFTLLFVLLVAYVAGYLSCVQTITGGHRVFAHKWQAMLFFPAVMIDYAITGEPENPDLSG